MVVILLGGSFVGNWTDEIVAWINRHVPTATVVGTPPDFPTFPGREDARLARFALLRHRATTLHASSSRDGGGDVIVCATSYDVHEPDDSRVETLLSRLSAALVPSLVGARVVTIEEPPHESYARRMASGTLMTYASSSGIGGGFFGYLHSDADADAGAAVSIQAPSYAAHTPRLLDTVLKAALGGFEK